MALFELTGFQRDLLFVIAEFDLPSGQQIMDRLAEDMDQDLTHGRLYPNLDAVTNEGYVEKGQLDRRTNYYELTEKGEQALHEHMEWRDEQISERQLAT